jgi:hypothetical protein
VTTENYCWKYMNLKCEYFTYKSMNSKYIQSAECTSLIFKQHDLFLNGVQGTEKLKVNISQISSSWASKMILNYILYALDWPWQTKHLVTVFGEKLILATSYDCQLHSSLLLRQLVFVWHCLLSFPVPTVFWK